MNDTEEEDKQALESFRPLAEGTHRLYRHMKHPHKPRNVAHVHKAEQATAGINTRIAVLLTKGVSSMWTAYLFTILAIIGLFGLLGWLNPFTFLLATWLSQQFLQLVFLPILSVGQGVLSRHQELQAEEQFNSTMKAEHNIEQIVIHLDKQDEKILEILSLLKPERNPREEMLKENETLLRQTNELMRQIKALEKMRPQGEA